MTDLMDMNRAELLAEMKRLRHQEADIIMENQKWLALALKDVLNDLGTIRARLRDPSLK